MLDREQKNIEVIKQLKAGEISEALKGYSGWGGLRDSIYNRDIYKQLKSFLSDAEINNIKETLSSAYFTPPAIVQAVYRIVEGLGFTGGNILEPAAGHGVFLEYMPTLMKASSNIRVVEIEQFSAQIIEALYHGVKVIKKGFEAIDFKAEFDLVIGNPPYGGQCLNDIFHPDLREQAIHHYFLAKSFRLLKNGGIVAMVLPLK